MTTGSYPLMDLARQFDVDYGDAQLQGLKRAMGAVVLLAVLSLSFTRRLPARPLAPPPEAAGARAP